MSGHMCSGVIVGSFELVLRQELVHFMTPEQRRVFAIKMIRKRVHYMRLARARARWGLFWLVPDHVKAARRANRYGLMAVKYLETEQ